MNIIYFIMNIVMSMNTVPMIVCCCDCLDAVFFTLWESNSVANTICVQYYVIGEQTVWDIHRLIAL